MESPRPSRSQRRSSTKPLVGICVICFAAVVSTAAQTINQITNGWCSPAIANVKGNVTVKCEGIDPQSFADLNKRLSQTNESLNQMKQEVDLWLRRYRRLETELARRGPDDPDAPGIIALLRKGKLAAAEALLTRNIERDDKILPKIAREHFERSEIRELEGKTAAALADMEKASSLVPENVTYQLTLARMLLEDGQVERAKERFLTLSETLKPDDTQLVDLTVAMEGLSRAYINLGDLDAAEKALKESIRLSEAIRDDSPIAKGYIAISMAIDEFELASIADDQGRHSDAIAHLVNSQLNLARICPTYAPTPQASRYCFGALAASFNNLARLHLDDGDFSEAATITSKGAAICREHLVESSSDRFICTDLLIKQATIAAHDRHFDNAESTLESAYSRHTTTDDYQDAYYRSVIRLTEADELVDTDPNKRSEWFLEATSNLEKIKTKTRLALDAYASALSEFATFYAERKEFDKARPLYQRAMDAAVTGFPSRRFVSLYCNSAADLATVELREQQPSQAEHVLIDARSHLPPTSPDDVELLQVSHNVLLKLAIVQLNAGKLEQSLSTVNDLLARLRPAGSVVQQEYIQALLAAAQISSQLSDTASACRYAHEADGLTEPDSRERQALADFLSNCP